MTDCMEDDDGIACNCPDEWHEKITRVTEGAEKVTRRGWTGKPPVPVDGNNWPLDFAAKMLGCSEKDLRDLIRITGLDPVGTMNMASYRRSGRHPRAYDGSKLVRLWQGIQDLAETLEDD